MQKFSESISRVKVQLEYGTCTERLKQKYNKKYQKTQRDYGEGTVKVFHKYDKSAAKVS